MSSHQEDDGGHDDRRDESARGRSGSGGPRTAEGKLESSKNATRHAINSVSPVAGGESEDEWKRFLAGIRVALGPVGSLEEELVMNMAICLWRKRRIVRAEVGYIGAARGTTVLPSALLPGQSANRLWAIVDEQMKNRDVEIEPGLELLERLPSNDDAALTRGAALSAAFLMMLCTANQAKSHDIENLIPPEWTCATFVKFVDGVAALSGISRAALIKSASTTALGVIEFRRRRALDEEHQSARDRANVLPHERQIDVLIRYQAQIDRSFARDLQHLELLQRLRNGQEVAPPTRVQVEVDRDEAVGE